MSVGVGGLTHSGVIKGTRIILEVNIQTDIWCNMLVHKRPKTDTKVARKLAYLCGYT